MALRRHDDLLFFEMGYFWIHAASSRLNAWRVLLVRPASLRV
jgi:hypothetical protein